jgi:hypothetical protein
MLYMLLILLVYIDMASGLHRSAGGGLVEHGCCGAGARMQYDYHHLLNTIFRMTL